MVNLYYRISFALEKNELELNQLTWRDAGDILLHEKVALQTQV